MSAIFLRAMKLLLSFYVARRGPALSKLAAL
jgi:hypothetical protein